MPPVCMFTQARSSSPRPAFCQSAKGSSLYQSRLTDHCEPSSMHEELIAPRETAGLGVVCCIDQVHSLHVSGKLA